MITLSNTAAEFASPIETVNCAINFQDRIYERNETLSNNGGDKPLLWRVGVHCDEVILENENVYGNGVNIAARLEAQCSPGQILVSRAINEQVVSRIEAISQAAGKKKLKNISDEFEVFSICTEKTTNLGVPTKSSEEQPEIKSQKPMIAILPFKNLNANEDSTFLIDGIFEDILTELSMVRQVSIVSRQSSMNFSESDANLDQFLSQNFS
ncbi:MAG: adenylate/guanylate cyclase domain-containing protein, partial [Rhodobacterales bacterium]|nr:adenylate/guanylate cyclase domain-containing protein [Rhodobacterales bacterium]